MCFYFHSFYAVGRHTLFWILTPNSRSVFCAGVSLNIHSFIHSIFWILTPNSRSVFCAGVSLNIHPFIHSIFWILTPNSRSVFCAGVSLNIHPFIHSIFWNETVESIAMATSSPISEDLTCAVCLDLYSNPRVLRCMHTYCHDCMAGLQQRNRLKSFITCPECRQNTNLDSRGVTGLPVNLVLSKVVETYRYTPL